MNYGPAELIQRIEAAGGTFTVEGERVFIEPEEVARPLLDELRACKPQILALLQSRIETESVPETDAVGLWMLARCVYRDRCWGGVGALYLDLARWCAEHGQPAPESRRAFTAELQAEGFAVTTDGLVYGLMLAEDCEAHERFQAAPQASETQAKPTAAKRRTAKRRRALQ